MTRDVVIVGVGARTHAGLNALQATLAVRAGKILPRPCHMRDRKGDEIGFCQAPIDERVKGLMRFVALAAPPLIHATRDWVARERARAGPPQALPAVIALPYAKRAGFDPRLRAELFPWLQQRTDVTLDPKLSRLVFEDRGGGVRAFQAAVELIESRQAEVVLVGGVDTFFDPRVLEELDEARRLHALEAENGVIPGEGAAMLLLAHRGAARDLSPLASLGGVAVESEPNPWDSGRPCLAVGMSAALRRAAGDEHRSRRVPWVLTDVGNERHRVDEWQTAFTRMFRAFSHEVVHDQPLLLTGEVGAASAALLAAMACVRWTIGTALGDAAMIATHSDGHERGALLLRRAA
jgi:3-oxoacyl-[acyl-carrier-protein] synthase-1